MTVETGWTPKLILDPVLHDEANFGNEDYAPYADHVAIKPEMF